MVAVSNPFLFLFILPPGQFSHNIVTKSLYYVMSFSSIESIRQHLTSDRLRTEWIHQGRSTAWASAYLQRIHVSLRQLMRCSREGSLMPRTSWHNGTEVTTDIRRFGTAARTERRRAERRETTPTTPASTTAHVSTTHLSMTSSSSASTSSRVLLLPAVSLGPSRLPDNTAPRGGSTRIKRLLVAVRATSMATVGLGCGLGDLTSGTLSASESSHLL